MADSQGRLFRFSLTAADITAAHELAAKLPSNGCLIGDMGYDAKKLRVDLAFRGTATVIPTNPTHKHQWYINRETHFVAWICPTDAVISSLLDFI